MTCNPLEASVSLGSPDVCISAIAARAESVDLKVANATILVCPCFFSCVGATH